MKYLCLVYQDEARLAALPDADLDELVAGCLGWVQELERHGQHVFSAGLQAASTATSLHMRDGRVLATDGPFTETKECLGGFTVFEARDLNEALHIASRLPAARTGTVEVRPVLDPSAALTNDYDRRLAGVLQRHSPRLDTPPPARTVPAGRRA